MPIDFLPQRASKSHRNRCMDAADAVQAVRRYVRFDREDLIAEIEWLAWRAEQSRLLVAAALLMAVARSMRLARGHEMLDEMDAAEYRFQGGAR